MSLWTVIRVGNRLLRRLGIFAVGLFTMLHLGPATTMAATMLVSLAIYAITFGWKFAAGFIFLLLAHELGHLAAARVVGVRCSTPVFIPYLGAVISLRQSPTSAKMEANIAIGGPATGTLSALLCLVFYFWTDSMLLLLLAYTACILNLFNLIPCAPLDGGRIATAISPHMWWIGSLTTGVLFFYTQNVIILAIFLFSLYRIWQWDTSDYSGCYYHLSKGKRFEVAVWYFGLLLVLGVATIYLYSLFP